MSLKNKQKENPTSDLKIFDEASQAFFELERQASHNKDNQTKLPDIVRKHVITAGLAYSLVGSLGYERLRELDRKGIVHGTLISDGSLHTTLSTIRRYVLGEDFFTRDNYEQLGRTCEAAKILCEKKLLY